MTANPTEPFGLGPHADRLLSWREVRVRTGLSRTTAWRLQNAGAFPRPVALSPGRVGWRETEIAAWTANLGPRAPAPAVRPAPIQAKEPGLAPPHVLDIAPAALPPVAGPAPVRRGRRKIRAAPGQLSFDF